MTVEKRSHFIEGATDRDQQQKQLSKTVFVCRQFTFDSVVMVAIDSVNEIWVGFVYDQIYIYILS